MAESKFLGMPISTAGTVLALGLLFLLLLVQFLSHVTGCRGLSAPEVKNAKVVLPKPPKRFSTTGNYESTRDLTGTGSIQSDNSKLQNSDDKVEL
jgi:hypothetical protein